MEKEMGFSLSPYNTIGSIIRNSLSTFHAHDCNKIAMSAVPKFIPAASSVPPEEEVEVGTADEYAGCAIRAPVRVARVLCKL